MNIKAISILLLPLGMMFATACSGGQSVAESPLVVEITRAVPAETAQRKEFPFISKPLRTSELSFRVSGPIEQFDVYAGNFYRRDAVIAEIDPRDFRLRYQRAEATWRRAKADYERIEALYRKDNVSASSYEAARAEHVAAETAYETAANDLEDTKLRAPFDGYVGEVFIERFQDVKASQPVVTLTDISELRIEIYVTQDIAMRADELREVSLVFDQMPDQEFTARVVDCARSTTPNNLSYLLTALLPNPDGKLPAGLSGRVCFDLPAAASRAVAIPQAALCHRPTVGDYVWAVDTPTGRVAQRPVTPGELLPGGRIVVSSGLKRGETVATSGLRFLSDGMEVQVVSDGARAETALRQ